jgi:hypothetical protein
MYTCSITTKQGGANMTPIDILTLILLWILARELIVGALLFIVVVLVVIAVIVSAIWERFF